MLEQGHRPDTLVRTDAPGNATRRLQGVLRPIITDFPFRDLAPERGTARAVEVLAARAALPPLGAVIRVLQNPETGAHLMTVFEGEHGVHWQFADLGTFWVDPTGWYASYELLPGASMADAESMLLGPVLGIAAQQRGETLLHASSVVLDDIAIAFSAPPGLGKSTLATSFIEDGVPLLSDDILPITQDANGNVTGHPYVPRAKLHDDSLGEVRGTTDNPEERSVSWWGKRRLRIGEGWGAIQPTPVPLRALYFLYPTNNPETPITFTAFDPLEATVMLQTALYSPPTLRGLRASRALEAGISLASSLRIVRVSYYRDFSTLPELRARLRADAAGVQVAGATR